MTDDVIFCAKTGVQVIPQVPGSNVIPFPCRATDRPTLDPSLSYVERMTIRCNATFEDIDKAAQAEIAALAQRFEKNDDI